MSAIVLLTIWCSAGISGLYWGGAGSATRQEAVIDYAFAAAMGPFAFLISFLSREMTSDADAGHEDEK